MKYFDDLIEWCQNQKSSPAHFGQGYVAACRDITHKLRLARQEAKEAIRQARVEEAKKWHAAVNEFEVHPEFCRCRWCGLVRGAETSGVVLIHPYDFAELVNNMAVDDDIHKEIEPDEDGEAIFVLRGVHYKRSPVVPAKTKSIV